MLLQMQAWKHSKAQNQPLGIWVDGQNALDKAVAIALRSGDLRRKKPTVAGRFPVIFTHLLYLAAKCFMLIKDMNFLEEADQKFLIMKNLLTEVSSRWKIAGRSYNTIL